MRKELDGILIRKLILAKLLLLQAKKQAINKHNQANRIMAVIGFDLVIETLLKVVVTTFEERKTPSNEFNGLIQQCSDALEK